MGREDLEIKLFIAMLFVMVKKERLTIGLDEIWWSQTVEYYIEAVAPG